MVLNIIVDWQVNYIIVKNVSYLERKNGESCSWAAASSTGFPKA